jgi:hypothetical protein
MKWTKVDTMIAESASLRLRDSSTSTAVYIFQGAHYIPRDGPRLARRVHLVGYNVPLGKCIQRYLYLNHEVAAMQIQRSLKEDHEDDWEDYED